MHITRALLALALVYIFLAVAMLRWHFSYGPPYYQPTYGLFVVLAVSAALVGLLSVWAALGALHWAKRLPSFVVGAAFFVGGWLLFFDWNQYLIWQAVVLFVAQMVCLVLALGCIRLFFGISVQRESSLPRSGNRSSQLSIHDLMVVTASLALLCAVLRIGQPVELSATLYAILIAGGCCVAFTALTALWISFSKSHLLIRLVVFLLVAPMGGWAYLIATRYESLLFSWSSYAGVTSLQIVLMVIAFVVVRSYGFTFTRADASRLHVDAREIENAA